MAKDFLPKLITWFRLDEHVRRLKTAFDALTIRVETLENASSEGIQSVTGDFVDNTDPLNPEIIDAPSDSLQYARQDGAWTEVVAGDAPTLQQVTLEGNTTNQDIISSVSLGGGRSAVTTVSGTNGVTIKTNGQFIALAPEGNIKSDILTENRNYQLPDQSGTLGIQNYKVYTALLTQSGTDAPTATVLENTLGVSITWTYQGVGVYRGTATGAFINDKTYAMTQQSAIGDDRQIIAVDVESVNYFQVYTYNSTIPANGMMVKNSIEIRVYN